MLAAAYLALAIGLVGHVLIFVGAVNRIHGLPLRKRWFKYIELPMFALTAAIAVAAVWIVASGQFETWVAPSSQNTNSLTPWIAGYLWLAAIVFLMRFPVWLRDRLRSIPAVLVSDTPRCIDVGARLGHRPTGHRLTRWAARLPWNEIFHLDMRTKELRLDRLPLSLDGLTIGHLSDIHLSGKIGIEFFEAVVDETNAAAPDVLLVTGDIFDRVACFEWLPRTLARLQAPLGVYFVLGNHDWRLPDLDEVRRRLGQLGWIDMGGQARYVNWRGAPVWLAGNERPWFRPLPIWPPVVHDADQPAAADCFRVALLHTPDQFAWAREHDFDLVLAGHTHGGQVRLPFIGPVFAPSLYGVKYAGGTFQSGRTVMHVSRGISGMEPLRWNCPPEVAMLKLRAAAKLSTSLGRTP